MSVLNRAQYCLLRSLKGRGISSELLSIFLNRCGASQEDWQQLIDLEFAVTSGDRIILSRKGLRTYNQRSKSIYF